MLVSRSLFLLVAHFSAGLILPLLLLARDEFGPTFDRLVLATAGLLVLGAVWFEPTAREGAAAFFRGEWGGGNLATFLFLVVGGASLLAAAYSPRSREVWIGAIGGVAMVAVALDGAAFTGPVPLPGLGWILHPFSAFSGALVLGTGWVAMLGGHWYLVNPTLPIEPLVRLSRVAHGAIVLRGVVAVGAVAWWWFFFDPAAANWGELLDGVNTFLLGRLLLGIALPFGGLFLVVAAARIRSTQSATGIMYFTFLFVLAGELMAGYVLIRSGIPI